MIDDIVKNGDKTGVKTEQLMNDLAKRSEYTLLKGGKYGSNNGFDHVMVSKTGEVVIIDSKQIKNGSVKVSSNGASIKGQKTNQLSPDWINQVVDNLPNRDPVKEIVMKAIDNKASIKTLIVGVDKSDSTIKLIPAKIPNQPKGGK